LKTITLEDKLINNKIKLYGNVLQIKQGKISIMVFSMKVKENAQQES
jgi:hypothetical protein